MRLFSENRGLRRKQPWRNDKTLFVIILNHVSSTTNERSQLDRGDLDERKSL